MFWSIFLHIVIKSSFCVCVYHNRYIYYAFPLVSSLSSRILWSQYLWSSAPCGSNQILREELRSTYFLSFERKCSGIYFPKLSWRLGGNSISRTCLWPLLGSYTDTSFIFLFTVHLMHSINFYIWTIKIHLILATNYWY